jgi:2-dehydro-3-deoxygluconokinase
LPEIIALGEPMAEFAAEQCGRLGEVRTFRRGFGGDTANFIVAAARMGASSGYVTRVGGDEFGHAFLALWEREGVDYSRVIVESEGITGVYFISIRDKGSHDFTYYRSASAASRLAPGDLDEVYIAGAKVFHTSGITQAISETAREAVETALDIAERAGRTISYDANVRPRLWPLKVARPVVERTFARAHLVFVSEEDIAHLYPGVDPEIVVEHVLSFGPRTVVLKRGAKGCLVATAERARFVLAAWSVDVVDASGAGDAFAGAFVASWLEGAGVGEAARVANTAGALTAMGLGAVEPIPTRAQVIEFIRERRTETDHTRK